VDQELEEFLKFAEIRMHEMAMEAIKRLSEVKRTGDKEISSETLERLHELDEKIARNMKFVKTKPPICKRCWFYTNYKLDDPKRYVLAAETKVALLPLLLLKPGEKLALSPEELLYDDYKKVLIVVCPTIECGGTYNLEWVNPDTLITVE
jgi:predicted Zn-ribbon and HTH transcriptional regulator